MLPYLLQVPHLPLVLLAIYTDELLLFGALLYDVASYASILVTLTQIARCHFCLTVEEPLLLIALTLYSLRTYIYGSQDAGFSSQMTQHVHQPIMAILVQSCWDFFLGFCLFFIKVCMKKN
jgi:hypothetical protein